LCYINTFLHIYLCDKFGQGFTLFPSHKCYRTLSILKVVPRVFHAFRESKIFPALLPCERFCIAQSSCYCRILIYMFISSSIPELHSLILVNFITSLNRRFSQNPIAKNTLFRGSPVSFYSHTHLAIFLHTNNNPRAQGAFQLLFFLFARKFFSNLAR
jgi:hypothetical protein